MYPSVPQQSADSSINVEDSGKLNLGFDETSADNIDINFQQEKKEGSTQFTEAATKEFTAIDVTPPSSEKKQTKTSTKAHTTIIKVDGGNKFQGFYCVCDVSWIILLLIMMLMFIIYLFMPLCYQIKVVSMVIRVVAFFQKYAWQIKAWFYN